MRKSTLLFLSIFALIVSSCKSDDDATPDDVADNILVGTTWDGQKEAWGIYTFSSNTEFRFVDPNESPVDGTYTFNGSTGILTEDTGFVAPFDVSGNIMSVEGVNSTRVYIKR